MISKKEDLAHVDLFSSPADLNSRKVKFAFKVFEGGNETPGEVIHWICNVERTFTGLNGHTGTLQQQMVQQLAQGSALSAFDNVVPRLTEQARLATVAVAQAAVNTDNGGDVAIANGEKKLLHTRDGASTRRTLWTQTSLSEVATPVATWEWQG